MGKAKSPPRARYFSNIHDFSFFFSTNDFVILEGRRRDEPQQPVDPGIAEAQAKAQAALQAYMEQVFC